MINNLIFKNPLFFFFTAMRHHKHCLTLSLACFINISLVSISPSWTMVLLYVRPQPRPPWSSRFPTRSRQVRPSRDQVPPPGEPGAQSLKHKMVNKANQGMPNVRINYKFLKRLYMYSIILTSSPQRKRNSEIIKAS